MRWLVVAVVAGSWAIAGWQNMPRLADAQSAAAGLAVAATCAVCWWVGRRSGRAAAVAVAVAAAEARAAALAASRSDATAQAAVVVNVGEGAREVAAVDMGGLDSAPWMGEPVALIEQDTLAMASEEFGVEVEVDGVEVE